MPASYSRLLVAALILVATCIAHAQDSPTEELSHLTELSLEQLLAVKITGASKFSQSPSDAPALISVLTSDEFHRFGWRSLAEALRSVQGMYVSYDRSYSYVGIRGFQRTGDFNTRILLLVDGYRVNDNIFDQAFIGDEFPIDVDLIERVEIIRGPTSSAYGGNALLGVINVITKSAAAVGGPGISASYGSYASREGRADYGVTGANGASLLLSASRYKSNGPSLAFPGEPSTGGARVSDTDWEDRYRLFGKFEFEDLHVTVFNSDRQKGVTGGLYGSIVDPRNYNEDRQSSIDIAYTRMLGSVETTAHVSYKDYTYTGAIYYQPQMLTLDKTDGQWWNAELKGVTELGRHKLVFGAEYQRNLKQDQTNYLAQPFTLFLDDHRSSDQVGLFAQDDIALTQKLTLSTGFRYDSYSYSGSDEEISPRVGLIYHFSDPVVAKLLYGTAFRPPNVYEHYYSFPGTQVGNPALKPEKIRSIEGIIEMWLRETTRLTLSAFHYRIDDLISAGTDPATGVTQFQNISEARTNGGSIELEQNLAHGIRLRTSYAYQDARDETGARLMNLPKDLVKLNASAPLPWGLQAAAEAQYTSRREIVGSDIPSYVIFNATLSTLKPWRGWDLSASVYNLFGRDYSDPADLGTGDRHLLQQDGRNFRLKGTYKF